MEQKCIYSLKTTTDATFETREHIIPACIGGMQRLPKGYVSDEVNSMFSQLELSFARKTEISLMRESIGPGKRGSLNPKKATASGIGIFQNIEDFEFGLGYRKLGKPYSINQMHIRESTGRVKFSLVPTSNLSNREVLAVFFDALREINSATDVCVIPDERLEKSEYIFGHYDDKWNLVLNPIHCTDKAKKYVTNFVIRMFEAVENNKFIMPFNIDDVAITQSQVSTNITLEFNYNDRYRVIAKIAFNGLAHLMGSKFVLQSNFDPIRRAIYIGESMSCFFDAMDYDKNDSEGSFSDFITKYDAVRGQKLGDQYHGLLFFKVMNKLKCAVGLYGLDRPHIINLAENINDSVFDVFLCDWRNKQEMSMIEYITSSMNLPKK
ncbi:MAG: hypothetical protein FWC73_07960 [Defluviitaleaceae bacterium]|nr:hypothetical protein [Defluviitaleaceae bacterium]